MNTPAAQEKCVLWLLLYHSCVNLPLMVVSYPVFKYMGFTSQLPLPSWKVMSFQILSYFILEDFIFYWGHRFLHTKWLYKHVHTCADLSNTLLSVDSQQRTMQKINLIVSLMVLLVLVATRCMVQAQNKCYYCTAGDVYCCDQIGGACDGAGDAYGDGDCACFFAYCDGSRRRRDVPPRLAYLLNRKIGSKRAIDTE
jgi:hypothetical protein